MDEIKNTFAAFTSASHKRSSGAQRKQHSNDNPIKGIYARLQSTDGILILAFHDLRDAASALTSIQDSDVDQISSASVNEGNHERLHCRFIMPQDLEKVCETLRRFFLSTLNLLYSQLIPMSSFITELEGDIYVSSSDASNSESPDDRKRVLAVDSLKNLLSSFGDLYRFGRATKQMLADERCHESDESESEVIFLPFFSRFVPNLDHRALGLLGQLLRCSRSQYCAERTGRKEYFWSQVEAITTSLYTDTSDPRRLHPLAWIPRVHALCTEIPPNYQLYLVPSVTVLSNAWRS